MAVSLSPRPATIDVDLLVTPWLPVVTREGERRELGLLDCLARADTLRAIEDPSPLVTFGIYRFLAAVLQTYAPVADLDSWAELRKFGRFPPALLERVRVGCAGRLRLFDAAHPFYQSGDIALVELPAEPLKTIGYLLPEASTGMNVTHFAHRGDADHALCPACCARALLALPVFAMSGGAGLKPGINGVPPLYVLPRGETVFATLLLNHLAPPDRPGRRPPASDRPIWEEDGVVAAKDERAAVGFVESLTFPPRRIRIFPSTGGSCSACGTSSGVLARAMVFAMGRSRPNHLPIWDDPWVAYEEGTTDSSAKPRSVRPRADREVWRDFTGLFLARGDATISGRSNRRRRCPGVVRQLSRLLESGRLESTGPIGFDTFGIRTDMKAKLFEWHQDSFVFPAALLDGRAHEVIDAGLLLAEGAGGALGQALERLHPATERATTDWKQVATATRGLVALWRRAYWRDLEPHFRTGLRDPRLLGGRADQAAWAAAWQGTVREIGRTTLEQAIDAVEARAADLRRQRRARAHFVRGLARLTTGGAPAGPTGASSHPGDRGPSQGREMETGATPAPAPGDSVELFARALEALHAAGERGALARLKRCAGRGLRECPAVHAQFYRLLPPAVARDGPDEEDYFLVATLFPLAPERGEGDLGQALRRVVARTPAAGRAVDRRLAVLLDATSDELPPRLRWTVTWLASRAIRIDWRRLLRDVLAWERPGHDVQKLWARHCFGAAPSDEA